MKKLLILGIIFGIIFLAFIPQSSAGLEERIIEFERAIQVPNGNDYLDSKDISIKDNQVSSAGSSLEDGLRSVTDKSFKLFSDLFHGLFGI